MTIILEYRAYRETDIDKIEDLFEKEYGKLFFHSEAHQRECGWNGKIMVDNTTIRDILYVVKTAPITHINCYVGED